MAKAKRGDKSFQPSAAGKGDSDRTTDREAYSRGYDQIDWGRKQPVAPTDVKHVTDEP